MPTIPRAGHTARASFLPVLLGVLVLAACGDGGTAPVDELTEAEIEALVEAFFVAGAFDGVFAGPSGIPGAPAGVPVDETFEDESVPCPLGGSVELSGRITGDLDEETGEGELRFQIVQVHDACRSQARGMTFTFDGNPKIDAVMDLIVTGTSVDFSGTNEGGIRWAVGGRSGTCTVDVRYALSGDVEGVPTASVTGTICGRSVSESF